MLRIENLSKTYKEGTRALKGISFEVDAGEFVAVLGKSGSGKSTLMRCVNRLVEPTAGNIFYNGGEITGAGPARLRAFRKSIGMIFQDYNLLPRVSVLTNVLSGRLGYTSPLAGLVNYFPVDAVERAHRNLERLGLIEKCRQRAGLLSGGQQQRVGIARVLMQQPTLILADEPVSSLDPAATRNIMDILKEINIRDRVTILCNLHLPDLAKKYASRIIALQEGEQVYDGLPGDFDESLVGVYGP